MVNDSPARHGRGSGRPSLRRTQDGEEPETTTVDQRVQRPCSSPGRLPGSRALVLTLFFSSRGFGGDLFSTATAINRNERDDGN